ncbi:MAG TPA: DUF1800 domain-containing protein [Steroidobacteraceae bacterium]|nr:DUF1800 domain-containing protein [Steroidobacteraceae bacterium]
MTTSAVIAVNRFGLGAKPGEISRAQADPRAWLRAQIRGARAVPESIATLPSSQAIFGEYTEAIGLRRDRRRAQRDSQMAATDSTRGDTGDDRQVDAQGEPPVPSAEAVAQGIRQVLAPKYQQQVAARYQFAATTDEPFRERLIHFWTNHFAVSTDKRIVLGLAGALENEAVRPAVHGRFVDMVLAAERHPAMILYLDNQQSVGPNSQAARNAARRATNTGVNRKVGLNENLAREILELHTLGIGGYSQTDVTTFAEILTGWSIDGGRGALGGGGGWVATDEPGAFIFRDQIHEPGAKTLLGKRYAEGGESQAEAVLRDLAAHPATATHIATKLVRHFVADEPPADAIAKVAKAFRDSEGDLPSVHGAVIDLAAAWREPYAKFKTPHEFVISTFRALDFIPKRPNQIAAPFELLGQRPYTPGSPAGWADIASQWDGADALMKRIEWATSIAERSRSRIDPLSIATVALGKELGDHTRTAISRAASAAQALTLLLMSPEFQRR